MVERPERNEVKGEYWQEDIQSCSGGGCLGEDNQWVASSQAPPVRATQLLSMIPYQTQNILSYQKKKKKASTRREGFTVSLLPAGPRTGGISTRRNPVWFLHRGLSQLNGQYWAVCELYTTAILAHERTGAWAVLSVCRADKPEGRAALSAMLSPTCRVQEKQRASLPRKRQLNLSSNYSNLEQDPCKGKQVRHSSEDYSKRVKFAWNFLNLPLQENSFPISWGQAHIVEGSILWRGGYRLL